MSGQISALKIAKDQEKKTVDPGDQIFLDFLRLAGTDLEELNESPRYEELNAKCEAASADITDQIFEYWSQNKHLEVKVELNEGRPEDQVPFNSGAVARARGLQPTPPRKCSFLGEKCRFRVVFLVSRAIRDDAP